MKPKNIIPMQNIMKVSKKLIDLVNEDDTFFQENSQKKKNPIYETGAKQIQKLLHNQLVGRQKQSEFDIDSLNTYRELGETEFELTPQTTNIATKMESMILKTTKLMKAKESSKKFLKHLTQEELEKNIERKSRFYEK
eukprot:TRINITY_DN18431_c0_g1_i1.p1 TRINITY_DN18431_c0_g1~~TRINITY_DN18431_c0_g1_i1.p1  ORF type:complete len:138 (-),score=31.77 TRINITY_DN18431_c0_g1_i1:7-420(-)